MEEIAPELQAILDLEQKLKGELIDPTITEITLPNGFFSEQLGLMPCMVGPDGRIWNVGQRPYVVIFDPRWLAQPQWIGNRNIATTGG